MDEDDCRICGGSMGAIMVSEQADPIALACSVCGQWRQPRLVFRRWIGDKVHMVDPAWSVGTVTWLPDTATWQPDTTTWLPGHGIIREPVPSLTVHCGPPAPRPYPPNPEEILTAAGLGYLWAGDAA